jgi:aspartokinase/homoserine dehydrogenase 1
MEDRPVPVPRKGKNSNHTTLGEELENLTFVSPENSNVEETSEGVQVQACARFRVLKFGGSSLASPRVISRVLQIVAQESQNGSSPVCLVVVVSAPGPTTDYLLDAADAASHGKLEWAEGLVDRIADLAISAVAAVEFSSAADEQQQQRPTLFSRTVRELLAPLRQLLLGMSLTREKTSQALDMCLSFGERLSSYMLGRLLAPQHARVQVVDSRSWLRTDFSFGGAKVRYRESERALRQLSSAWREGDVICMTGFIGMTEDGKTTTLGRNGSDYTATLCGQILAADGVIISTDSAGVMTADPAIVPTARPVLSLTYDLAVELSLYGARMFHPRSMIPLMESGVPLLIRSTEDPHGPCTCVHAFHDKGEEVATVPSPESHSPPTCVTSLEHLGMLEVHSRNREDVAHLGRRVFKVLEEAQCPCYLGLQAAHGQSVSVLVPLHAFQKALLQLNDEFRHSLEDGDVDPIFARKDVTLLSLVVEEGLRETPSLAWKLFGALRAGKVNVLQIATGKRSLSCVIDGRSTAEAVRTVHDAFHFSSQHLSIFIITSEDDCRRGKQVAREFINLIERRREALRRRGIEIRIVGIHVSPRFTYAGWNGTAVAEDELMAALASAMSSPGTSSEDVPSLLERLALEPGVPILVDLFHGGAPEGDVTSIHSLALARGIHVVPSHSLGIWGVEEEARCLQHGRRGIYSYDSVIGGSIPLYPAINDLVSSGENISRIQLCFNGGLGFVLAACESEKNSGGLAISEAILRARELRQFSCNLQDELSGQDTHRRLSLLLRKLGEARPQIRVKPMIAGVESSTPEGDDGTSDLAFEQEQIRATENGCRLRYIAQVDFGASNMAIQGCVELHQVPRDHPAFEMDCSCGPVVMVWSDRYDINPLILKGGGSTGKDCATGAIHDILRIATRLKGGQLSPDDVDVTGSNTANADSTS